MILGGGIAGLIFAFYNKDYWVVAPEIGGQMNSNFNLGPRYLHETENAKKFLKDVDEPIKRSTIKVGYIDDGGVRQFSDKEFRKNYFMKSRGVKSLKGFDDSVMSGDKNTFPALDIDCHALISKLKKSIEDKIITGIVTQIDVDLQNIFVLQNKETYSGMRIEYNHLISTIPLNRFYGAMHYMPDIKLPKLKSFDMTYVLVDWKWKDSFVDYDFVYDSRSTTIFHRMSRADENTVLDFFGSRSEKFSEAPTELRSSIIDIVTIPNCQIISINKIPKIRNVIFVGRYGAWNREWKTEKVIDVAMEHKER